MRITLFDELEMLFCVNLHQKHVKLNTGKPKMYKYLHLTFKYTSRSTLIKGFWRIRFRIISKFINGQNYVIKQWLLRRWYQRLMQLRMETRNVTVHQQQYLMNSIKQVFLFFTELYSIFIFIIENSTKQTLSFIVPIKITLCIWQDWCIDI